MGLAWGTILGTRAWTYLEDAETTLTSQSTQNDAPSARALRPTKYRIRIRIHTCVIRRLFHHGQLAVEPDIPPRLSHRLAPQLAHLVMLIPFARKFLIVRVVPERGDGWIGNHDGFEVESAVADVALEWKAISGWVASGNYGGTYINASTSASSFGAVQPRTSPGLRGLTCGMTISYAPRQTPSSSALTRIKWFCVCRVSTSVSAVGMSSGGGRATDKRSRRSWTAEMN